MRKGDIVRLKDGSWSLELTPKGELERTSPAADQSRVWRVIAVNCELPAATSSPRGNDTIIQDVNNPIGFVFTRRDFLKAMKDPGCKCCCDEIFHELMKARRRGW